MAEGKYFVAIGEAQTIGEGEIGTELANLTQCVERIATFTRVESGHYLYRLGVRVYSVGMVTRVRTAVRIRVCSLQWIFPSNARPRKLENTSL